MNPYTRWIFALLMSALTISQTVFAEDPAERVLSKAELDQLLAPIALYPDTLLSQVLTAATYPLEVVQAARWSAAHPELKEDAAIEAVAGFNWDDSVKALVAFPELIQLMNENLEWMANVGDAFLADEALVLETVQDLRQHALENGGLDKMEHARVVREAETIIIEPADVRLIRVPYYTRVVYGDWWWPDNPPYFWDPPYYNFSLGIHWSRGFHVSSQFYHSTCYWPSRKIVVIDRRSPIRSDRSRPVGRYDRYTRDWRHDPLHRRGVRYQSPYLRERYQNERFRQPNRIHVPHPPTGQIVRPDRRRSDIVHSGRTEIRQKSPVVTRPELNRRDRPTATTRPDRHRPDRRPPATIRPDRHSQDRPPATTRPDRHRPDRPPVAVQLDRIPPPVRVTPPASSPPSLDMSRNHSERDSRSSYRRPNRDFGGYGSRSSANTRRQSIPRNDP